MDSYRNMLTQTEHYLLQILFSNFASSNICFLASFSRFLWNITNLTFARWNVIFRLSIKRHGRSKLIKSQNVITKIINIWPSVRFTLSLDDCVEAYKVCFLAEKSFTSTCSRSSSHPRNRG